MTRLRLRPAHSPQELAGIYATPHDHTQWRDHMLRVDATLDFIRKVIGAVASAADLSCGAGAVLRGIDAERRYFGDFAAGFDFTGPLEETLAELPHVELFINTETLEHLDDPDLALRLIRGKADQLILSTPIDRWDDPNQEHYWAWSKTDVEDMLTAAGWDIGESTVLDFSAHGCDYYQYGLWAAR